MFDQLVDGISAALWNLRPDRAVALGKHEYDGVVPELTEAAVGSQLDRLHALRDRMAGLEGLDREQRLDRAQLTAAVDTALITWEEVADWRSNPMVPLPLLDVTPYLSRQYAPFAHRAEQAAAALSEAPRLLSQARACLRRPVPEVFAAWAHRVALGMAGSLDGLPVDGAEAEADPGPASFLTDAAGAAAAALRDHASWIETDLLPDASGGFAVGGEALEAMLRKGELVDLGLDDLLALGEADLEANLEALEEAAALLAPGLTPAEAYERHVAAVHAGRGGLAARAAEVVEGLRSFVVDRGLVTVPGDRRPSVRDTPAHLRWAFAYMDAPGPYEAGDEEAFYYVTPPDPGWDDHRAEEWLRALNDYVLEDVSIHEAFPGHFVHSLHLAAAPTEVSRRVASYAFVEGWAHYAEQMLWEQGYRDGDPAFRMAQLVQALVRDCRFVAAIKMHSRGMSLDEAARLFARHALYDETPARAEAERGAFDPAYYSYTLGKLLILRLRAECEASEGPSFDLRTFHDRLLSRGAPPVAVAGEVVHAP